MTWLAVVTGALIAGVLAFVSLLRPIPRLVRRNYAGRPVPAMLGLSLVGGAAIGHLCGRPEGPFGALEVVALGALILLLAVGVVDDLVGGGPRGLLGHLRSLVRGRPTTGILKLAAGIAAGIAVSFAAGGEPFRIVVGAVLVGTAVNVFNALDVVPGRSLKWAAIVLAACLPWAWATRHGSLTGAALGAALAMLPFDLRERAMLGDGGSNPLGLLVGLALLVVLPTPALIAAAVVLLLLQVAAETVTISRTIDAVPPLVWLDALGRR